ncbi:hypothetical protein [Natrinema hispanicum]|nr:hypothetical protein [Natrinema hispanicum]
MTDTTDEFNRSSPLRPLPRTTMTDTTDTETSEHLRAALRHLEAARQQGELRKTNAVALENVSNTVSTVLREYEGDE